ncbi:hypothetical protein LXA43DRAFT_1115863 [Ganoderma leucocontextum]|nr:hypothetical protein LXA43DRAFT_1115863 [Ganoderma leucocontextum]
MPLDRNTFSSTRAPWSSSLFGSSVGVDLSSARDLAATPEASVQFEDLHNHLVAQSVQVFVTSFLLRCLRANIEHMQSVDSADIATLDVRRVLPPYRHSKRPLLVDFEGTIWTRDMDTIARNGHARDLKNQVWLLSGLTESMLDVVAEKAPKIGIV